MSFFYLKTAIVILSEHFITNSELQRGINEIFKTEGVDFKDWKCSALYCYCTLMFYTHCKFWSM